MTPQLVPYLVTLLMNFVDNMGSSVLAPVIVPLGRSVVGATDDELGMFGVVRGVFWMSSVVWMAWLSDLTSRRFVVLISMAGSGVGYMIQGMAGFPEDRLARVITFAVGRGCAGLFAGTGPVLRAFVQDLYADDPDQLYHKLLILQTATQAMGLLLTPLAGVMATINLLLPFWVCAGASAIGLVLAILFFKDVRGVEPPKQEDKGAEQADSQEEALLQDTSSNSQNPWTDKVVLMLMVACLSAMIPLMGAFTFLLPDLLFQERFNIGPMEPGREAERAANVAKVLGYLMFPDGLCNMITTGYLFMPLKARFGESRCVFVAGSFLSVVIACFGFANNIWVLAGLMIAKGFFNGFMLAIAAPLAAKYSRVRYPTKAAQVQSIPMLGISLGATLGQTIVVEIKKRLGITWAWVVCAGCILVFVALVCTSIRLIDQCEAEQEKAEVMQDLASLQARLGPGAAQGANAKTQQMAFEDATQRFEEADARFDPVSFASSHVGQAFRTGAARSRGFSAARSRTGLSRGSQPTGVSSSFIR